MKNILLKEKVLIFAILISAIWHILWISLFNVVAVPEPKKSVKFSNVSFLGPILERGVLSVKVKSHERTIPEKEYLASIEPRSFFTETDNVRDEYVLPDIDIRLSSADNEELTDLTLDRISVDKIEPGREMD